MEQTIQEILNHISVLNDDYTQLAIDVGVLKSQMASILYWGRLAIGAIVVLLISQAFQIFQIKKNNNKK